MLINDYGLSKNCLHSHDFLLNVVDIMEAIRCFSLYAKLLIYSSQVEVHDVGKEMELDLIKQYSQVLY